MSVFLLAIFMAAAGWLCPSCSEIRTATTFFVPVSEQNPLHIFTRHILTLANDGDSVRGGGALQHTISHENCPACGAAKNLAMDPRGFGSLTFSEAFPIWLETRTRISEGTRQDYKKNFKRLEPFFGAMRLSSVHIGHILEYRKQRQETAGPGRINKEVNTLSQMFSRAGLWDEIAKWYEPLPMPKHERGIALTEEEERYFFEVAQRHPKWSVAYYCDLIMRNTGIGPGELRHVRLKCIDVGGMTIRIEEGLKNGYRERVVPLTDVAYWCVLQLMERAAEKGSSQPEHYLLPMKKKSAFGGYDPTVPMWTWQRAHEAIRREVVKRFPRLATLRRYDFRHTACTVMLENPAISYPTIERIMGHRLGSITKEVYSHVRDNRLREAVNALETRRPPAVVRGQMYSFPHSGKRV